MANDPIRSAAAATAGLTTGVLLEATIKRNIYVLNVDEVWADFNQPTGEKRLAILDAATSFLYLLDATDTTTPDDGYTCRVDGDGNRYHIEDAASVSISSVLASQDSPPGSPANYDAYIVGDSPTGAWVGHATEIAIYTRRGWVFAEPEIGMTVFNVATGSNLQFDDNGDWVPLAGEPPDGSILPVHMAFPAGLSVEAQQNAPPSVPSDPAITYLVGTAGSGDWSGHNNALAFSRDGTTWEFIAAYEGATAWNKATDTPLRYTGSAWVSIVSGVVDYQVFTTPGAATWNKPSNLPANAMVLVQMWGGGGGGNHGASNHGAGGGGGAYKEILMRAADLASSVSLNIGAGGSAGASSGADGGNGGNSTFGSYLTAYGGGGGSGGSAAVGGGGGGASSAGATSTRGGPTGLTPELLAGGASGAFTAGSGVNGGANLADGGGGGAGGASSGAANNGGSSHRGGGGGGGGNGGTGGASVHGGNGGNSGAAGSVRGGGGGGKPAASGAAGAGGRGEIRVTVFA